MAKYFVQGLENEFVEDSAEISYLKFNNLRHTVLGCMMGDFNEQGKYVVEPSIVKELIKMPKYIVDSVENIDICHSELKLDRQLSFMISCEKDRAVLLLVEKLNYDANFKINAGSYSNINEYVLDEVKTAGVVDRNLLYTRWNIKLFGGKVVDVFNDETVVSLYPNIVNRFKYLLKSNRLFLENEQQLEDVEEEFANKLLEILTHYPELKKVVDEQVKEEINSKKNFLLVDKPYFAKTLNEILEKFIRNNISVLPNEKQKEFNVELHNLYNFINVKRTDIVEIQRKSIKNDLISLDMPDILIRVEVGDYIDDDLIEVANQYVMFLKNGKINPRFHLIDYLISIGVLKVSIGLKPDEKENMIVAGAKKEEQKKNVQKVEKKDDKKKAKGKAKAKAKKDGKKKEEKKKETKKTDDKNKKNNLINKTYEKKKVYYYVLPTSAPTKTNATNKANAPTKTKQNVKASNIQSDLLNIVAGAKTTSIKTKGEVSQKQMKVKVSVVESVETTTSL